MSNALLLEEQQINAQLSNGFIWLRFAAQLEKTYCEWRCQQVRERARPVGYSVIFIFLLYSLVDYLLFPMELSRITIGIRLLMICPGIAFIVWASYRQWSEPVFINVYTAVYLWSVLGVAIMIMLSHLQRVWMPYDGLILLLMGGYFLLGLPFRHVVAASWLLIPVYVVCESFTEFPPQVVQFNVFFLVTANLIGTVGVYLMEHSHRLLYLNKRLLEIAKKKAEEDSEAKSKFVAMASHDLRQPLHAMHLLVENLESEVPEAQLPIVKRVKESVRQLNQLMRSVLDISKINFGIVKVSRSHFSLSGLCFQIFREYESECRELNIRLINQFDADLWVYCDSVLVERIIRNLVVNAIDHSGASQISIVAKASGAVVEVAIVDNGRGIIEQDQQLIFEEFKQSGTDRGIKKGMGLGLAIVKQFADILGVQLQLVSQEGRGCSFILRIAAGVAPDKSEQAAIGSKVTQPAKASAQGKKRKVVVIDDNTAAVQSLAEVLRNWGYDVSDFCSPQETLDSTLAAPDLLISDYHLQAELNGIELIQALRAKFDREIPAILMTADTELAETQTPLVAMSIAPKPVMPAQLRLLVSDRLS